QLWARRFEVPLEQLLELADQVATEVAGLVSVKPPPLSAATPVDSAALDLYLRGRHEYHHFYPSNNVRAVHLLGQAHERAPDCSTFAVGYALALSRHFAMGLGGPDSAQRARQLALRTLRAAPQLAEPRLVLAALDLNMGRGLEAARELRQVVATSPALVDAQE